MEIMEQTMLNDPRIGFFALLILSLADLYFSSKFGAPKSRIRDDYFDYETGGSREIGGTAYFALALLKISPAFMITLIWAAGHASKSEIVFGLYRGILGFSVSLYLIINLRHIESILFEYLARRFQSDLSGKLTIKKRFSLGQSAVQIFTLSVILFFVAALRPHPVYFGLALAPLALIARNLYLIRI